MDFTSLTAWLRLPQRVLWGLTVVSALILWGPGWFIDGLGLQEFIDEYRTYLGVVFLFFLAAALPNALQVAIGEVRARWAARARRRNAKRRLHDLTEGEKVILRRYVDQDTRTQALEISDGDASGLVSANIIYRSSSVSVVMTAFPYNIQPWAWDYIREHPAVLLSSS